MVARYFLTDLFTTSACALHCEWAGGFILVNLQEVANLIKKFVTKLFPFVGDI